MLLYWNPKKLITICTDSQAAIAALAVSGTKSLLVADCIEKLTVLSGVNQVIIFAYLGIVEFSRMRLQIDLGIGIKQNETADRLAREKVRVPHLL